MPIINGADHESFRAPKSGLCKCFKPRYDCELVVKGNADIVGFYKDKMCYIGIENIENCDFCLRKECLYYKPTLEISDENSIVILEPGDFK